LVAYGKVNERIVKELEGISGSENVTTRTEDLIVYSVDASLYRHNPDVVVRPRKTEEISAIMKLATREKIPVTPRGASSGAAGSAVPIAGGILLDMTGMNRILSIDADNQIAIVEAGVVCDDLNEKLEKFRLFFPPDPSSGISCTLGGMINTNAAGNRALKYGDTKDFTQWLEVVLPSGDIIHTGSKTLKSVSGFDLTSLIAASEGSLAIVTKACLKVVPLPNAYSTAMFVFDSVEALARATARIRHVGLVPEMLEFMDKKTTKVATEYAGLGKFPEGNFMLVDYGGSKESVNPAMEKIIDVCKTENPKHIEQVYEHQADYRMKLIEARKAALPALARLRPCVVLEDCTVPLTKLPEAAAKIEKIPETINVEGFGLGNFGHIGDGNMHPCFVFDDQDPKQMTAFEKGLDMLYKDIVLPLGGSVTAEHGIGLAKAKYLPLEIEPRTLQLMRDIKKTFDPYLILNPGKGKGGPYPLEAA
jgi:glycolate oxidase